jgi:hypothetical protein
MSCAETHGKIHSLITCQSFEALSLIQISQPPVLTCSAQILKQLHLWVLHMHAQ